MAMAVSMLVTLGLLAGGASSPWQATSLAEDGPVPTRAAGRALAAAHGSEERAEIANERVAHESEEDAGEHDKGGALALVFFVNVLVVGAAVLHLTSLLPWLQSTIVLFVLGMLASVLWEGLELKSHTGVLGHSYDMWMSVSPHVLLYALLPALLAGDAMTIDTSVARKVSLQCLYLAGPGVVLQAFVAAGFLSWLLDWSFLLSMTVGSILTATDPVAVVALLKELQASPVLTVQIQGEALLNDGTAMVLYTISYAMLSGEDYDYAGVAKFFVKSALMAWVVGCLSGYFFFFQWIRLAGNKFDHSSTTIQIMLTIGCPYWTFVMCEAVFGMSGILATVACSLTLAHCMWPYVVCTESMHHVWEMLETVGNLVIFFVAGALTGNVMVHITPADWLYLLAIYLMLTVLRAAMIFASRPLLSRLAADRRRVSCSDAAVMTWGGLRGALGLTLALEVHHGLGGGNISELDGQRVLFFVAGIAFLTILVNGSTCPSLVAWLQITALPKSQQRVLSMISQQLVSWSSSTEHPPEVVESLRKMLADVSGSIGQVKTKADRSLHLVRHHRSSVVDAPPDNFYEGNEGLADRWGALKARHEALAQEDSCLLGDLLDGRQLEEEDTEEMVQAVRNFQFFEFDVDLVRALTRTFLSLLRVKYERMMEEGRLRPGSSEADALTSSIHLAQSPPQVDLTDWGSVKEFADAYDCDDFNGPCRARTSAAIKVNPHSTSGRLQKLTTSKLFNVVVALLILANVVTVAVQELTTHGKSSSVVWLELEALFSVAFFAEFALRLGAFGRGYFHCGHNKFDAALAIIAVISFVVDLEAYLDGRDTSGHKHADIIRLARTMRVLRLLYIFRLFHLQLSIINRSLLKVSPNMHKINALVCFIRAHLESQKDMQKYFGCSEAGDAASVARVILQSQCEVYDAIQMAVRHERKTDKNLLSEVLLARARMNIAEGFEGFVHRAWKDAAIGSKEAEALLRPIHAQIAECLRQMDELREGRLQGCSFVPSRCLPKPEKCSPPVEQECSPAVELSV